MRRKDKKENIYRKRDIDKNLEDIEEEIRNSCLNSILGPNVPSSLGSSFSKVDLSQYINPSTSNTINGCYSGYDNLESLEEVVCIRKISNNGVEIELPEPVTLKRKMNYGSQVDTLFDIISELCEIIKDYKGGIEIIE